jgi:hypothetical protein
MSLVLFSYFSIVRFLVNGEDLYTLRHNHSNIHTIQQTGSYVQFVLMIILDFRFPGKKDNFVRDHPTITHVQFGFNKISCFCYPIYSFKSTLSLLKYAWICIKLMTLMRIVSVGFNGNNTIF